MPNGGEWGEEITFYFDTMPIGGLYTLTARDGMTWADYIASDYNTVGFELYVMQVYTSVAWNGITIINLWSGISVRSTDIIISEETYGVY